MQFFRLWGKCCGRVRGGWCAWHVPPVLLSCSGAAARCWLAPPFAGCFRGGIFASQARVLFLFIPLYCWQHVASNENCSNAALPSCLGRS